MRSSVRIAVALLVLTGAGCPGPTPSDDAGAAVDAGAALDGGSDGGGVDAGLDGGADASADAGPDAGVDAGLDGSTDAGVDAGPDAGLDAGSDAGLDAGSDAGVGLDAGPAFVDIAPPGGFVSAFAFVSGATPVIYAGIDDSGGLFRSVDQGATWQPVPLPRQNLSSWDVHVAPGSPSVITIVDPYGHGVFRSTNGGVTWVERNASLAGAGRRVRAVVGDPANADVLYIGTGSGVFKSTDGALTWTAAASGLPPGVQVFRLALDPSNPDHLVAGLAGGDIYRTINGGASWTASGDLLPGNSTSEFWDLVMAPSDPNRLLASAASVVQASTNGGATWQPVAPTLFSGLGGFPLGASMAFSPTNASAFYLATCNLGGANRRWKTTDDGQTFTDVTGPTSGEAVLRLRVNPDDGAHLVAGLFGDGVERSTTGGTSWLRHTGRPSMATAPGTFAQAPSNPARLYLAGGETIARSSDNGVTWQRLASPFALLVGLDVHPADADTLALSPYFGLSAGVGVSTNGAQTVQPRAVNGSLGTSSVLFDRSDAGALYASGMGSTGPLGVYRSNDLGLSWSQLTPSSWYNLVALTQLAHHPTTPGALLAVGLGGLWASDAAQTLWTQNPGLTGVVPLSFAAAADGLWVAGARGAVYVSQDSGQTWTPRLFPDTTVVSVTLDPARPNRVLLGLSAQDVEFTSQSRPGLYLSEDRGATFVELTQQLLPSDQVFRVVRDRSAANTYLLSVYSGAGGLYRVVLP